MNGEMNDEHEAHLRRVLDQFVHEASDKYREGQRCHGGRLWEKPGMLAQMKQEAIDQVVYTLTLEEQIPSLARRLAHRTAEGCEAVLRAWLMGRTD